MTEMFKPHDYQLDIIKFIQDTPRCAVWAGMGTGKTASTLTALDHLSQVEDVFPVLVLAPLRVARTTWPDEVAKWANLRHLRVSVVTGTVKERERALRVPADVYTANYEQLQWLVSEHLDNWPFKTVVADECFVAGTLVSTPKGPRPIETLKDGDLVDTHIGPRPVTHVYRRLAKAFNLVCLTLSTGVKIYATETHPFFTDAGWLPAGACAGRQVYGQSCLSDLSNRLCAQEHEGAPAGGAEQDAILHSKLPVQGGVGQTGASGNQSQQHEEAVGDDGHLLELWSCMVGRDESKNVRGSQGASVSGETRGQRDRHVAYGGADSATAAGGVRVEPHTVVDGCWGRLSVALQAGLRAPSKKDVSGGGWADARHPPRYVPRPEKDGETTVVRVDRVSDKEHGGMVPVFNVEVAGAPTYFVNGVLVHNCTRLKSFRLRKGSTRAKALSRVAHTDVSRFIGLTGTPSPNGLNDLWGQTWFLDKGQRLGHTFGAFEARWFTKGWDGYSLQPNRLAQQEIEGRLRDVCLTVTGLPVDAPIVNNIQIDLPRDARAIYDEMEKEMFAEIEEFGVEAVNAAVKTMKLLQLANGAAYVDDNHNWREVHKAKIEALESVIEEANGAPVLVAYHFKSDLVRLQEAFPKARVLDAKPQTIHDWNAGKIPILLAHPACLHPRTEVLTEHRGWVKIVDVERDERVFDGIEFVSHGGCSFSGVSPVVDRFGLTLTPNHKLLIDGEWVEAKDVRNSEAAKEKARYRYTGAESRLGKMLSLRGGARATSAECPAGQSRGTKTLRGVSRGDVPSDDQHEVLVGLERDGLPSDRPGKPGLGALWRGGPRCGRGVALVQKLLQRHVRGLPGRSDDRADRQLEGVFQGKLSLGDPHGAAGEQEQQSGAPLSGARHASGGVLPSGGCGPRRDQPASERGNEPGRRADRLRGVYVPERSGVSPVYDLIDCGPRHRFVVRNDAGEVFVSHNSAGHGLNLAQGGNILCFFSVNWNLEEHMQIIERVGPMRQKQAGLDRPVFLHHIVARDTVDAMILERLKTKRSVQDILLENLKRRKK